jgi:hypothetical protein
VHLADLLGDRAHAAGHDHRPFSRQGLADRIQRLLLGAVDEAAGVDHHHVGVLVGRHDA